MRGFGLQIRYPLPPAFVPNEREDSLTLLDSSDGSSVISRHRWRNPRNPRDWLLVELDPRHSQAYVRMPGLPGEALGRTIRDAYEVALRTRRRIRKQWQGPYHQLRLPGFW